MRVLGCLALLAGCLSAEELVLRVDPAHSSVAFRLSGTLHTTHGSFAVKRGDVRVDSVTGKASGDVLVDVKSGQSGNGARDRRMHSEILESARYPDAIFTVDEVRGPIAAEGDSQVQVHGVFLIHGAKHAVTVPANVTLSAGKMRVNAKFAMPYVAWGMKNPSNFLFKVDDAVELEMALAGQ